MSQYYQELMESIGEAITDVESSEKRLKTRMVTVVQVKEYGPEEIKEIRRNTGLSQRLFASYMGVSNKTVEAWERGINQPSGTASRILHMMELDKNLIEEFPFVQVAK